MRDLHEARATTAGEAHEGEPGPFGEICSGRPNDSPTVVVADVLRSVQSLWHRTRPELLNSVMEVGLVPGGINQSRNTCHVSAVRPWSEDVKKTMRTRVSVFIAIDPKGLLKENGEEDELDVVFQSSTGSVLVKKLISPIHFVSVQVTINGVWKEVWNRKALNMTACKITVKKEYVRACPPGTKYDLCDIEGSIRPGHIGQMICPACKMAIAKGSLLCLSGQETPTAPSGMEDHGVHSGESEVVHGLGGPPQKGGKGQPKGKKEKKGAGKGASSPAGPGNGVSNAATASAVMGVSNTGTAKGSESAAEADIEELGDKQERPSRCHATAWKKNVFRYYRHAWPWYNDAGFRRKRGCS